MHHTSGRAARWTFAPLSLLAAAGCLYTPPKITSSPPGGTDHPCLPLIVTASGGHAQQVGNNVLFSTPESMPAEAVVLTVASANPGCSVRWVEIGDAFGCDAAHANAPCNLPPTGAEVGVWLSPAPAPVRSVSAKVDVGEPGGAHTTEFLSLTFLPAPAGRAFFATVDGDADATGTDPAAPTTLDHAVLEANALLPDGAGAVVTIFLKRSGRDGGPYYYETLGLNLHAGVVIVGGLEGNWQATTWGCGCEGARDARWDPSAGATWNAAVDQCLGMHAVIMPSEGVDSTKPLVSFGLAPTATAGLWSGLIDVSLKTHASYRPSVLLQLEVGAGVGLTPPVFRMVRSDLTLWGAPIPAMRVTSAVGNSVQLELERFTVGLLESLGADATQYRFVDIQAPLETGSRMTQACVGVTGVRDSVGVTLSGGGELTILDSAFVTEADNTRKALLLETNTAPAILKLSGCRLLVEAATDATGIFAVGGGQLIVDRSELQARVGSSGRITGVTHSGAGLEVTHSLFCAHGGSISDVWPIYGAGAPTTVVSGNIIDQVAACGPDGVTSLSRYLGIQVGGSIAGNTALVADNLVCGLPTTGELVGIHVSKAVATVTGNVINGEPCGRPIPTASTSQRAVGIDLMDTFPYSVVARNWVDPGTTVPSDEQVFALSLGASAPGGAVRTRIESNALVSGSSVFALVNTPTLGVQTSLNTILLAHRSLTLFTAEEFAQVMGLGPIGSGNPVSNNLLLFAAAPTTSLPTDVLWSNSAVLANTLIATGNPATTVLSVASSNGYNRITFVGELGGVVCSADASLTGRPSFNPHLVDLSVAPLIREATQGVYISGSYPPDIDNEPREPGGGAPAVTAQYRGADVQPVSPYCAAHGRPTVPAAVGVPPP